MFTRPILTLDSTVVKVPNQVAKTHTPKSKNTNKVKQPILPLVRRLQEKRNKKNCKDQEMIQSSTTTDPGYLWESNKNTINITNKSKEVTPFPAGDNKAAMNRRESMRNTKTQMIQIRSTALEQSVKYFTGGLKQVSRP